MSIDGVFIHHLIDEIKSLKGTKINRVIKISESDYCFLLPRKIKLLLSIDGNHPHIRITNDELVNSSINSNFYINLKKYCENSYIENISQYNNDRIVIFSLNHYDDLGFMENIYLIIELFGRNSNIIITKQDGTIIDSVRKTSLFDNERVIIPKAKYIYPTSNKINPYTLKEYSTVNLEGVSNLLLEEIKYQNSLDIILKPIDPVIIETENKRFFYCFDLEYLIGNRIRFNTLSEMLDFYYKSQNESITKNNEQKLVENHLTKEIKKLENKKIKLEKEYYQAIDNLECEKIGNILSSNLYNVKKGMNQITLFDYYNNCDIIVNLDPLLSPTENLNSYYTLYKKSKRALSYIEEQQKLTDNDINYYQGIIEQLSYSKNLDLKEIIEELDLKKRLNIPKSARKNKPNYTIYNDIYGGVILVGKNNIQNKYLTYTIANKDDIFFHVKSIGGSHVILREKYTDKRSELLAADIAAYYSKYRDSINVNVDMTKVRNVRKVPGTKGSFVTYSTYQTIFANPNLQKIQSQLKS